MAKFNVGDLITCADASGSSMLVRGGTYTVVDSNSWDDKVKLRIYGQTAWFNEKRFVFYSTSQASNTPVNSCSFTEAVNAAPVKPVESFEDKFTTALADRLREIAEDNSYTDEYELGNDQNAEELIAFASDLGFKVDIESAGVKVTVSKHR